MNLQINQLDIPHSPRELFLMIPDEITGLVYFSSDGSEGSRYSVIAMNPVEQFRYDGSQVWRNGEKSDRSFHELMNEILRERKITAKSHLPFLGGLIGSIDYEYGYELMQLPKAPMGDHQVFWNVYDHLLIFDHQESIWSEVLRSETPAFAWREWPERREKKNHALQLQALWDEEQYTEAFQEVHKNIQKGEIYQACLSFPFEGPQVQRPRESFTELIERNPAPMAAYLEQGDRQILSLSPERFLHWDGSRIETKPIKGTRPRSSDPSEDLKMQKELLEDEKERAELNMITDLLRNDLSQVCEAGTVQVLLHHALQTCPSIWHTYSHIVGKTKQGISAWDIIRKTFPGGSISGCPKRRALEILRDLEHSPRGVYTGCIGYISDHGQMDLNIAIRTLENKPTAVRASFGGGIVYDSEAKREYQECYDKARIFL